VTRIERRRAIRRRRARLVTVVCAGFCMLVLATSFPVAALLRQHASISAATSELERLTAGNQSLRAQASDLSQPANVAAIAQRDYDMVRPGQTAYRVLPSSSAGSSGHSALDQGPVVPGSPQSQALVGADPAAAAPGSGGSGGNSTGASGTEGAGSASAGRGPPGLWSRVLASLEFWR
jgi:cell division protein FtsB